MGARWAFVFVVALSVASPVFAQSASEMVAKSLSDTSVQVDDQVVNASKAVEEAVKGWRTNGESVRGASGAIGSLLIDADTLICAGWLISYERAMTNLATAGAFETDQGTAVVSALQQLKRQIERVCDPILTDYGDTGGGGGGGAGGGEGSEPVRSDCPECDDEKAAYERAKWAYERAQFELERAHARTDFVFEMWSRGARATGDGVVTTPREAERIEEQKQQDMERAQRIMETARQAWLACVDACHKRLRDQFGFFDRSRTMVVAGLVGAASTVALVVGGSEPRTQVATSPVTPAPAVTTAPVSTAPPVQTTPPPAPAPPSPAGNWRCASCQRTNDPDDHERVLQVCRQLADIFVMAVTGSTLRITHPEPWVTLDGSFAAGATSFLGAGMGRVGSFSGVSSRGQVTFQTNGSTVTSAQVILTLGENGVFPGGRPVTYSLMLVR